MPDAGIRDDENFYHDKHGWCHYAIEPNRAPLIFGLYVMPEYRRQGHGRRLLSMVKNLILATGYTGPIEVEAQPTEPGIDATVLVRLYSDVGLTVI